MHCAWRDTRVWRYTRSYWLNREHHPGPFDHSEKRKDMKTRMKSRQLLWGATLAIAGHALGQASVLGNTGLPGNYLGWDGGTMQALEVRHNGNQPIQWYTDSLQRMQLYPINSATLNTFVVPRTGFVGISPIQPFYTNPGPFTRLHLVDSAATAVTYAQDFGFRPWMRNGVLLSQGLRLGPLRTTPS